MKKIFLTSAVVLALLSGCNNDYDGRDIAGSKLVVSASIDQVKTRASDTEWAVDDAIGVSDNLSLNPNLNIKYVAGSTTGSFTSTTGIYILGSEPVTYTAYYPYKGAEGTSGGEIDFSIVDDDGKYVGSSAIDFMFAQGGTASRENPQVNFTFKHMMSKLKLDFKDSGAATTKADSPISYTLRGVTVDGKFNTVDGSVTPGTTKGNVTVETTLGTASSVILPPASDENQEEIQLVITIGDKIYSGTFKPALDASQEYQYSIDLSKTGSGEKLQIDSPTIDGWTPNDGENIGVKEDINLNPTLEIGDFLCKDGTTIDKDYALDDELKTNIAAVVYYVGNPQPSVLYSDKYTTENDLLLKDYPACTHGLAISLAEMSSVFAEAETSDYCLHLWFNETSPTGIYPAGYNVPAEVGGTYGSNNDGRTNFLGYNNTNLWKSLASAKSLSFEILSVLSTFQEANPITDATMWYILSSGELSTLIDYSTGTYQVVEAIANSLSKVSATEITGTYWSSTDGRLSAGVAQIMAINTKIGSVGDKAVTPSPVNATKEGNKIRFAVAF